MNTSIVTQVQSVNSSLTQELPIQTISSQNLINYPINNQINTNFVNSSTISQNNNILGIPNCNKTGLNEVCFECNSGFYLVGNNCLPLVGQNKSSSNNNTSTESFTFARQLQS